MNVDPQAWGIEPGYHDVNGEWRAAPEWAVGAALDAMGAEGPLPPTGVPVWVVRTDQEHVHLGGPWQLHTEDGGEERVSGSMRVPPAGYHDLINEHDGRRVRLIVSPGRCHLPPDLRTWGWALQLYALRSHESWGFGDLADLRRFGRWASELGAGMTLVNPLHSPTLADDIAPSPYYPGSRCYRNPLYLRIEEVPGAALVEGLDELAAAGRQLNDDRWIDRAAVWRLKSEALEQIWRGFDGDADFDRYCEEQGNALAGFAAFNAFAEVHGPDWRRWPPDFRHPESPDVVRFVAAHVDRVRYHQWLQWLLDRQLAAAGEATNLVTDLAIGVDPAGADAWLWQGCFVEDASTGAPPDSFNTSGQDWGVPPFDPWRLRAALFEPFIQTVRAGLRHSGGLRVDHVMGLFRLFWVPKGGSPADGLYVRYPWEELLDILALESMRAGAYVIGEDLGTVEPWVREELGKRNVLSYRLMWFEPGRPEQYPQQALAAVTTHDLPTVAGMWTGADFERQRDLGMRPSAVAEADVREHFKEVTGVDEGCEVDEVVRAAYRRLAAAPSAVLTVSLDDVLGVRERPNYPGTTVGSNWSLALPAPLEDIEGDERVHEVAKILRGR